MRVFLVGFANMATGGTELLHQFGRCLGEQGIEVYMVYPNMDGIHCPTPPTFLKYGVKYVSRYIDASDSILVLTETQVHLIQECKKGIAMIWWLSVDNHFNSYRGQLKEDDVDIFGLKGRKNLVHFVQSYYAKDFVNSYFSGDNCYFLMDYINDEIVEYAFANKDKYVRKNICVYNPKKGYDVLKPIISACRDDIAWVPLINMKPTEMADSMCKAKLYVDFGAHPGKDRIPREAAICGCCVLTNQKGSAAYSEDVTIPEQYKIEDTGDTDVVLEKIYDLIDNYEERVEEYSGYRRKILGEKAEFIRDMQNSIAIMKEKLGSNVIRQISADCTQYEGILDSISSAAGKVSELAQEAKAACCEGSVSNAMNGLLTIDYVLQVIRETVYAELSDMANL